MIKATCSVCQHSFDFDPKPQLTPNNEILKYADKAPKTWRILIVCPKCGHRKMFEVSGS